jgi:hypothetical protein
MAQQRVRLYIKKKLVIDGRLTFDQKRMYRIGTIAVGEVKDRVKRALNETDSKSKPLNTRYAIRKTRFGKRNVRDLSYTGDMLNNFTLRTVSDNEAFGRNTTKKNQDKARGNNLRERWVVYSRKNADVVVKAANDEFNQGVRQIVKSVPGNYVSI